MVVRNTRCPRDATVRYCSDVKRTALGRAGHQSVLSAAHFTRLTCTHALTYNMPVAYSTTEEARKEAQERRAARGKARETAKAEAKKVSDTIDRGPPARLPLRIGALSWVDPGLAAVKFDLRRKQKNAMSIAAHMHDPHLSVCVIAASIFSSIAGVIGC